MSPVAPLALGGLVLFRLFGLVFVVVGALNVVRPREMTTYAIRRRAGGPIEGHVEPTQTRLVFTRLVGVAMVVIGLGLAAGVLGP